MSEAITSIEGLTWFKSSASNSGGGGCVEGARLPEGGGMAIRDSKDPDSPVLSFTAHEWDCFLAGVAKGEFAL